VSDAKLRTLLADQDEHVRTWAIRLLTDGWTLDTCLGQRSAEALGRGQHTRNPSMHFSVHPPDRLAEFARMAREDQSGLVRLTLASLLQRLPPADRAAVAAPLLAHPKTPRITTCR